MRTGHAEDDRGPVRRRAFGVPVLLTLLSLLPLTACSQDPPGPIARTDAEVEADLSATLRQRARAITDQDRRGFTRTLGRGAIRDEQSTYFDNLGQLPVEVLRYRVVPGSVRPDPKDDRSWWAVVATRLQLDGYDAAPITTRDRWRFTLGEHGRRYLLSSTTDAGWEREHAAGVQPWDTGPIVVEERLDALGIFDADTARAADDVLESVADGRFEVGILLPDGRNADESARDLGTVVYVLSDAASVEGLASQTVGDPERADGLTIAIPTDAGDAGSPVAGYRIALSPRVLGQEDVVRDRLVRHELTHALLGAEGRGAPLWITEGVAEYVSVHPQEPAQRRLPASALAVGADADALPTAAEFSGPDAAGWYAVAWWVCEYVASTGGESTLWALLDQLAAGADQETALEERLGLTESQLVQRGVALMASSYRR
ncbi:hypothetical protein [Nocardioides sp. YIM 152588]|uniref:hypothetical protein n=1 Tax=Nocardioides sp. YIM 152588 TaxID=3158259 RepID=UPI0032E44A3D